MKEDDWRKFEKNNVAIALNVLNDQKEKICHAYFLKYNSNREKQVNFLIIPNAEKWHYLVVKKFSVLLREITSKNNDDLLLFELSSFL